MGRPKEYDEHTASDLLEAAERIIDTDGLDALSVRRVADEVGVTTRAVYSLFGSKDALLIALGARAFHLLRAALDTLPATNDPASDLVEGGVIFFRRFVLDHPALLRIGVLHLGMSPELVYQFRDAADHALVALVSRVARLATNGQLGSHSVADATCAYDALCQGLALLELRCVFPPDRGEQLWRDALSALVVGWRTT